MKKRLFKAVIVAALVASFTTLFSGFSFAKPRHHKVRGHNEKHCSVVVERPEWYVPFIFRNIARLYWDSRMNRRARVRPVIVTPPANTVIVKQAPAIADPGNVTVNILNSNGTYTAVVLRRYGDGYMGPQNEYYPQRPTVRQLEMLYGN